MDAKIKSSDPVLRGSIKRKTTLKGTIHSKSTLKGKFVSMAGCETYSDSFTITPTTEEQTLNVKGKRITENISIEAIPFYEVANEQNGQTIIIGG